MPPGNFLPGKGESQIDQQRAVQQFRRLAAEQNPNKLCCGKTSIFDLLPLTGRVKTLAVRRGYSARARRINCGDSGIPAGRAHCIRNPLASGVDHEISKVGVARRGSDPGSRSDPEYRRAARRVDHERPCIERPRASVDLAATAGDEQSIACTK